MSRKLHPLAAAIRAIDALSDGEKLALRDYLRPAPKPRQKGKSGKSVQKRKQPAAIPPGDYEAKCACGQRFGDNVHHLKSTEGFHEFEPAGEAKGASG